MFNHAHTFTAFLLRTDPSALMMGLSVINQAFTHCLCHNRNHNIIFKSKGLAEKIYPKFLPNQKNFVKTPTQVASWEHLEHIPTIKLTFVQSTFVLATFVHIRNISAVTDQILIKLYR